jgi:NitT/TauT family transport system substrate-binding protein
MKRMSRSLRYFAFLTFLSGALISAASAQSGPLKIRVGWVATPASLTPILFAKDGIAKHNGKSYVLVPMYFGGSSTAITAVQAGELDIATLNFSTVALAVQNAGLRDLKVIADEIQDGTQGGFSLQFMVRKDSQIRTVADLKGKVLATIGRGSGAHIGMLATVKRAGLEESRDYTLIESPFPTMKALLKDRKVDLVAMTTGFAADPDLDTFARTLFTQRDGMGPSELSFWTARGEFISKNRGALVDFLEDVVRANRWYMDPANHKEAVAIVAAALKRPPEQYDSWIFTAKNDFYRAPDLIPNIEVLQKNIDLVRELGVIAAPFDVRPHVDLSPLQEAMARIK